MKKIDKAELLKANIAGGCNKCPAGGGGTGGGGI